jgi:hypothetical protein
MSNIATIAILLCLANWLNSQRRRRTIMERAYRLPQFSREGK